MKKADNLKVVLDTNLIISAIISINSIPGQLFRAWRQDRYILIVSIQILEEIKEVSQRDSLKRKYPLFCQKATELFVTLKLAAEVVKPLQEEELIVHCRDPKDDKLLTLALAGGADYIVTGDRDLLILHKNPLLNNLKIVTAKDFLALL